MKIAIGCDHTGVELKKNIIKHLEDKGHIIDDYGVNTTDASSYPDVAHDVCKEIQDGKYKKGVLICGSGVGISIAANKHKGIRAVVCSEPFSAKMAVIHNDANILCFGSRVVGSELAKMIVDNFFDAEFEGGRHQTRVNRISEIENGELK